MNTGSKFRQPENAFSTNVGWFSKPIYKLPCACSMKARFCGAEGLDNVKTVSAFRNRDFAEQVGVAMVSGALAGLTARAVIVLDENNRVLHSELVPEIKQEPNYESALAVL